MKPEGFRNAYTVKQVMDFYLSDQQPNIGEVENWVFASNSETLDESSQSKEYASYADFIHDISKAWSLRSSSSTGYVNPHLANLYHPGLIALTNALGFSTMKCLYEGMVLLKPVVLGTGVSWLQIGGHLVPCQHFNWLMAKPQTNSAHAKKDRILYLSLPPKSFTTMDLSLSKVFPFQYAKPRFSVSSLNTPETYTPVTPSKRLRRVFPLLKRLERNLPRFQRGPVHPQNLKPHGNGWIPCNAVFHFLWTLVQKHTPKNIFGGEHNWRIIEKAMQKFISLGRFEAIDTKLIASRLKTSEIPWLQARCKNDFEFGRKALEDLIWFYFDYFVPLLVLAFFHVTDVGSEPQQVYYYPKSKWRSVKEELVNEKLKQEPSWQPTEWNESSWQQSPAVLRVVPKTPTSEFRTVLNLKKVSKDLRSTNNLLASIIRDLDTPYNLQTHQDALYYISKYRQQFPQENRFYLLKADLSGCFDNIQSQDVLKILTPLLQDHFVVNKHQLVHKSLSKRQETFVETITPLKAHRSGGMFRNYVGSLLLSARSTSNHVFNGQEELSRICEILKGIYIRSGPRVFFKTHGLPQGLSLSGHLCNLLLADIMATTLDQDDPLCLRFIDDFMIVSTSKDAVISTFQKLQQAFGNFGLEIKPTKVENNFDTPSLEFLGFTFLSDLSMVQYHSPNTSSALHKLHKPLKDIASYCKYAFPGVTAPLTSYLKRGGAPSEDEVLCLLQEAGKGIASRLSKHHISHKKATRLARSLIWTLVNRSHLYAAYKPAFEKGFTSFLKHYRRRW